MHDCGAWTGEAHKHIESSHLTPEFGLTPEFEVVLPQGTMDDNIKVALRAGAPLEAAYAMGSYYPARHWHIEDQVGSIAPGRDADVVLLTDPATVSIDRVYVSGQLVGAGGQYVGPHIRVDYQAWATNTINFGPALVAEDLAIRVDGDVSEVTVALLEPFYFEDEFLTSTMPVASGLVQRDPAADITKVGLVDRYHGAGAVSRMSWRNVGSKTPNSAAGCPVAHDLHNLWVVGSSDEAMAMVVNEAAALQGCCVLVNNHEVVTTLRYEIGGLTSQRPAQEVADEIDRLYPGNLIGRSAPGF